MMPLININLLPYREEMRRDARRQFAVLAAGSVGLAAAVALAGHMVIAGYQASQEQRNAYVKGELVVLDKKIEEIKSLRESIEQMKAQQRIIEQLQSDRSAAVQVLDQMARLVPSGVYLKGIKQTGGKINAAGYALSQDLVSAFMSAIETSPYLTKPELVEIKSAMVGNRRLAEFSLNFELRKAEAPKKADEPKKGGAKGGPKGPLTPPGAKPAATAPAKGAA